MSSLNLTYWHEGHGEKLTDIPDEYLTDVMPIAKKIAAATGAVDYNILQNNGKIAHQVSFKALYTLLG